MNYEKQNLLGVSHVFPVHCGGQLQKKSSHWFWQLPPLAHGLFSQKVSSKHHHNTGLDAQASKFCSATANLTK